MAILYVEDDELTRAAVAGRLRRRGYEVLEAGTGEEALALAAQSDDLEGVILDIELPGINGLETFRQLRDARPRLAAVVCSASLPTGVRQPLLELGIPATCLLSKPCQFDALLAALEVALDGHARK